MPKGKHITREIFDEIAAIIKSFMENNNKKFSTKTECYEKCTEVVNSLRRDSISPDTVARITSANYCYETYVGKTRTRREKHISDSVGTGANEILANEILREGQEMISSAPGADANKELSEEQDGISANVIPKEHLPPVQMIDVAGMDELTTGMGSIKDELSSVLTTIRLWMVQNELIYKNTLDSFLRTKESDNWPSITIGEQSSNIQATLCKLLNFFAKDKFNNDPNGKTFPQQLMNQISVLVDENSALISEIINLRSEQSITNEGLGHLINQQNYTNTLLERLLKIWGDDSDTKAEHNSCDMKGDENT